MDDGSIVFAGLFGCLLVIVVYCYGISCYTKQLRENDLRGGVNNLTTV